MTTGGEHLETIRGALRRGEYLLAYDQAVNALDAGPTDAQLQYFAVLALARAGATTRAEEQLAAFGLENREISGSVRLAEDVAALSARLAKDRALHAGAGERRARAVVAAARYEAVYERFGRPFACINSATMALLAGDDERAVHLAAVARKLTAASAPEEPRDVYWDAATAAEAALILSEADVARVALERAADASGDDLAARAVTRKQLRLVCTIRGIDTAVLDALPVPAVMHYCGHQIPTGAPGLDRLAADVAAVLDRQSVAIGFGALACGADIVVAEQLLRRGAQVHVVLPFDTHEFETTSVVSAGEHWAGRFHECLAGAESVTTATPGGYLGDDALFPYGVRRAMGEAVLRADALDAPVSQLAVWDEQPDAESPGTAAHVETWCATGRKTAVVPWSGPRVQERPPTAPASPRRVLRAMLFGDVNGFSEITEAQVPVFFRSVMGALGNVLDAFGGEVLYRNSWGDGIYAVLEHVAPAAECALAMQQAIAGVDLDALGLPDHLALRIGVHAGPVYEAHDPIRHEPTFFGAQVTRTARIEPATPEGEVYVTDAYAAALALEPKASYGAEYVGHIPTAKGYGNFPMYVLKARS
ncbi:MAG: adenylate/guanylate cyclase domain-containing protein [Acidimicrobiia bacterium]